MDQTLESWPGFGLPSGSGGRRYSLFGPLLPLVQAPFVAVLDTALGAASAPRWRAAHWQQVPASHYYGNGLKAALYGDPLPPATIKGHVVRSLVSLIDVAILVLIAGVTFDLGFLITRSELGAWLAGALLALGTFLLGQVTTAFSEPLAVLLTLFGLKLLARNDPELGSGGGREPRRLVIAGLAFGLATTAHMTALLSIPFAALYAAFPGKTPARDRAGWRRGLWFAAGVGPPLALLATYNLYRFGNPLETGRGLQTGFDYGAFVAPWEGLLGLTLSFGKGLLWYCPVAVASLMAGFWSYRVYPRLVVIAIGATVVRILFIASRSDWHGGFCLGPRYLLLALPFTVLPALLAGRDRIDRMFATTRRRVLTVLVVILALCEQFYFASGEVFVFYHLAKRHIALELLAGAHPNVYFSWRTAPLSSILTLTRGPFVLRWLDMDPYLGWTVLTVVTGTAIGLLTWRQFPSRP